jgi:hypothetical protein
MENVLMDFVFVIKDGEELIVQKDPALTIALLMANATLLLIHVCVNLITLEMTAQ